MVAVAEATVVCKACARDPAVPAAAGVASVTFARAVALAVAASVARVEVSFSGAPSSTHRQEYGRAGDCSSHSSSSQAHAGQSRHMDGNHAGCRRSNVACYHHVTLRALGLLCCCVLALLVLRRGHTKEPVAGSRIGGMG